MMMMVVMVVVMMVMVVMVVMFVVMMVVLMLLLVTALHMFNAGSHGLYARIKAQGPWKMAPKESATRWRRKIMAQSDRCRCLHTWPKAVAMVWVAASHRMA